MTRKIAPRWAGLGLVSGLLLLFTTPAANADLLQFNLGSPVVTGVNGTLNYNATTGEFQSTTNALTYSPAPAPGGFALFSGTSQLTVDLFVNSSGNFVSNGAGFQLTGNLDLDGDGTVDVSGTLLSGTITAFGADPAGPPTRAFNGLFTIQSGLLTGNIPLSGGGSVFGGFPIGGNGGFILFAENVTSGTLGDFTRNFGSSSVKEQAAPVAVPEPASWLMALLGATCLGLAGCWKKRAWKSR